MGRQISLVLATAIIFAACSNAPQRGTGSRNTPAPIGASPRAPGGGGYLEGDGPGADAPANFEAISDAVPQAEPLHRYANRPYAALGKSYTPLSAPGGYKERGIASWYGKKFHGQPTAIGEIYDMYGMTAAHTTLPLPSYARVTNLGNGKSVVVRINDRGPFMHERIIDLSYTAARKLGIIGNGSAEVEVESIATDVAVAAPMASESIRSEPLPPEPSPPVSIASAGGNVYLQLGAFKSQQSAQAFLAHMRAEFEGSSRQIVLYQKGDDLVRVHIGPYASQDEARAASDKLQTRLGFKPFVSVH